MAYETLIPSISDGIATILINRPKAMNAVNMQLLDELILVLDEMENNPDVKAMIITGGDKVFAAGADLKTFVTYGVFDAFNFVDKVHKAIFKIEDSNKPVIAAICGLALGGGTEVALACDLRVSADNATFGLPEINMGIYPGGGGTQRLPRIVGLGRAKELIMTGDFIDAKRAYEIGMVNYLVPSEQVMETAVKVAKKLSKKPPLALRMAKNSLNNSMNNDIKTGCRMEQEGFAMLFSTFDQKECMAAFAEGRKANITGS